MRIQAKRTVLSGFVNFNCLSDFFVLYVDGISRTTNTVGKIHFFKNVFFYFY